MLALNVIGFISPIALIAFPDSIFFAFFLLASICFIFSYLQLIFIAIFFPGMFFMKWGWLPSIGYSIYLMLDQVYTYLRYGEWMALSLLTWLSRFVDLSFLRDYSDWRGLKELLVVAGEFLPASLTILILSFAWMAYSIAHPEVFKLEVTPEHLT